MTGSPAVAVPTLAAQRRQVIRNDGLAVRADLNGQQAALELGQAIPLVIGKRTGATGGVLISPPAAECRFTNDEANRVTASYLLVLADGQLGTIAATDAYQGNSQLVAGEITQAYGARAESWAPGNFIQQRFHVTFDNRVVSVAGPPVGDSATLAIDWFGVDDNVSDKLEEVYNSTAAAKATVKSNGNYVTYFRVTVDRKINWPTSGVQVLSRGNIATSFNLAAGTESTPPSVTSVNYADPETLPWERSLDSYSYYGGANAGSPPSIRDWENRGQYFTVGNSWIYERADEARSMSIGPGSGVGFQEYLITRPPSLEPYGDIEVDFTETIRRGFVTRETLPGVSLFGGLPGVTYNLFVEEQNSEPLPKPEATLYCGTGGTYSGLTTVSLVKAYPAGDTGWQRQAHFFIRNGQPIHRLIEASPGATNLFPDAAHHLLIASGRMPSQLIDVTGLTASSRFCSVNGITFDGVIANPSNVREYLNLLAPMHLLRVTDRWGMLGLRPALPVTIAHAIDTSPLTPVATFNESNSGEFQVTRRPISDRKPFAALVLWRDQPENDVGVTQATEVRYAGTAIDGPYEDLDGSEFMTRELHAVRAGAFRLAQRRHITHDASWVVVPTPQIAALRAGDIVRMDRARNPVVGASSTWSYLYEIETISGPLLGPWTIQASHHPVNDAGSSLLALEVAGAAVA